MKAADVRELTRAEAEQRLQEQVEARFNLRMQVATGQLDNVRRLRQVRRDIARLKTRLRELELAEQREAATS